MVNLPMSRPSTLGTLAANNLHLRFAVWVVLDEHIEGEIGYPKLIGHKPSISTVLQRKVFGCQYVAGFDGNGPTLPKCCL
jgi:hypothetical protein